MPLITVEGPRLPDIERKRELVKKLYEIASDIYRIDEIIVLIKENSPENVGLNGKLASDR